MESSLFQRKKQRNVALIVASMVACFLLIYLFILRQSPTVELTRVVSEIDRREDVVYLHCEEENTVFSIRSSDFLGLSDPIKVGDAVVLFVGEDYRSFETPLLRGMSINGERLFDTTEQDRIHNEAVAMILGTAVAVTFGILLICACVERERLPLGGTAFEIRNSSSGLYFGLAFAIGGAVGALLPPALYFLGRADAVLLPFSAVFALPAPMGLLLIYVYYREAFTLKNGVYTYRKPFRGTQAAEARAVRTVIVESSGAFLRVTFWGENDQMLIRFLDDGTAFRSGEFEKSLRAYGIELHFSGSSFLKNTGEGSQWS